MYDGRTKLADQVTNEVRSHFGPTVLRTVIPRSVKVSEAPGYSQTVLAYDPGSRGAMSYVDAAREIARKAADGSLDPDRVDERTLARHLYAPDMPDPDLVVRTSGEYRISNFLLWELAYSELLFTDVLWPDFRREHLFAAVREFQNRDRRYGGVKAAGGTA